MFLQVVVISDESFTFIILDLSKLLFTILSTPPSPLHFLFTGLLQWIYIPYLCFDSAVIVLPRRKYPRVNVPLAVKHSGYTQRAFTVRNIS
jgi:hypothetical protein